MKKIKVLVVPGTTIGAHTRTVILFNIDDYFLFFQEQGLLKNASVTSYAFKKRYLSEYVFDFKARESLPWVALIGSLNHLYAMPMQEWQLKKILPERSKKSLQCIRLSEAIDYLNMAPQYLCGQLQDRFKSEFDELFDFQLLSLTPVTYGSVSAP